MENNETGDPRGILEGHAPAEHYDGNEDEARLVTQLKARFDEAEKARAFWEQDANFFLHFLQGNQLILRSLSTNEVLRVSVVADNTRRLHSIDNVLRPIGRALVGKLCRIIPGVEVLPATTDQSELRSATVANSFLDYMERSQDMRRKYLHACKQLLWGGTAIFQLCWNKHAGRRVSWCETCNYTGEEEQIDQDCPQCQMENEAQADQQNQQIMQQEQQQAQQAMQMGIPPQGAPPELVDPEPPPKLQGVKEGDVEVLLHDPRDCFPEPGQVDIAQMRWFIVRRAIPVSRARGMFPAKAMYIKADEGIYTERSVGFYGNSYNTRAETQFLQDHVYLYEFHEAPTAKHPKGRLVTMVNDMIVEHRESPYYEIPRLPFYRFVFETNEAEFWGESFIAQSWHIQKELNKLLTQLRTHRELTNNPQKLVPMQSRISASEWDDQPGRHVRFNPIGGKPAYLETPQFPAYVYAEVDRLKKSIMDKAGVTEQELGATTGDPSGRFAAIQEAQSSEAISPVIVENNTEWLELHRGMLILAQKYYSPERVWTVTGRDRVVSHTWKEMNLSPGWDCYLAEEDSLSKNPALRLQQAQTLLQLGVFSDPVTGQVDMRAFKRTAGLRLPGIGPDLTGAERAYAAQIPESIKRGAPFQPQPWDDCEIVAEELTAWLRGEGRHADQQLVMTVGRIWQAYMQILAMQQRPVDETLKVNPFGQQPQQQGAPGQGAPGAMAVGGQPKPQQQGAPSAAQEAAQITKQADQQGEWMARQQANHEG